MRVHGDYRDDMVNGRLSDLDLELLLRGQGPGDGGLAVLAPFIEALRNQAADHLPGDEEVARVAAMAAEIARETQASRVPRRKRWTTAHPLAWRLASTLGAGMLVVGLGSGVAVAVDGAVPGDPLYGVDRALEKIGIGAGGTSERIAEANQLLGRGQTVAALIHIAESLIEAEDGEGSDTQLTEAANALRAAAVAVTSSDRGESDELRNAVAEMIEWMAEPGVEGREFGQGIAERARGISRAPQATSPPPANQDPPIPDSTPGNPDPGPPKDPPGNSPGGEPGPPTGPPGSPHDVGGQGNPGGGQGNQGQENQGQGNQGQGNSAGQGNSGNPGGGSDD